MLVHGRLPPFSLFIESGIPFHWMARPTLSRKESSLPKTCPETPSRAHPKACLTQELNQIWLSRHLWEFSVAFVKLNSLPQSRTLYRNLGGQDFNI